MGAVQRYLSKSILTAVTACVMAMATGVTEIRAQVATPGFPVGIRPPSKPRTLDDRWPLMFTWNRNKVNWWDFSWRTVQYPSTTLYYYQRAEPIARLAQSMIVESDSTLQADFAYDLQTFTENKRIPKIIYTSHHTFEQTNTIAQQVPEGVLGFTEFIKGRVVFPYTGSNAEFRHVLEHENTHIHMIHKLKHVFKTNGIFDISKLLPPIWFSEGLAEYESVGRDPVTGAHRLDPESEMYIRDALLNDDFPTIKQMRIYPDWRRVYKFGHILVQYLGARYGAEKLHEMLSRWHHQFPNRGSYTFFRRRHKESWDLLNPGVEYLEPYFIRVNETDYPVVETDSGWRAETEAGLVDSISGESVEDLVENAQNIELDGDWFRIVDLPQNNYAIYRPDRGRLLSWGGKQVGDIVRKARQEYEKEAYKLMSFDRLVEWWYDTDLDLLSAEWQSDMAAYYEPWLEGRTRVSALPAMGRAAPELWPTASNDGRLIFYKAYQDEFVYTAQVMDRETGHTVQLARENTPEIESIHVLTEGGDVWRMDEGRYLAVFTAQRRSRDVVYTQELVQDTDGRLSLKGPRQLRFDPGGSDMVAITGVRFAGGPDRILFSGLGLSGYQDIYIADLSTGSIERRLTSDLASDRMPVLWGDRVVFSSDRASPPTAFNYHLFSYDLRTDDFTQLTDGTGNELNPTVSPDSERLFFQSDATGVSNIYYWTESGTPFQVTDVATGVFVPAPVSSDTVIVSGFTNDEYLLYTIVVPSRQPRPGPAPDHSVINGVADYTDARLVTVRRRWESGRLSSADQLAIPEVESRAYRPAFSLDDFYASSEFGGYRSYNASVFGTEIRFSDILGNHHVGGALWDGPLSGLEDLSWMINYWNQKNRVKLGASIFKIGGIYYNWPRQDFYFRERAGVQGQLNLPFSQFSDLFLTAGTATERRSRGTIGGGSVEFDQVEVGAGFTRDVSTWGPQGPHSGWVFSTFYNHIFNASEKYNTFSRYVVADFRGYLPLHKHIVTAVRIARGYSTGAEPEFFFLSGGFFLRGYWDLYTSGLYGTSYELFNAELRLQPLELMKVKPIKMFENSGWPLQFVLFADKARTYWRNEWNNPRGGAGASLRLTLALPFILEYAWYRLDVWDGRSRYKEGLVFTLMF